MSRAPLGSSRLKALYSLRGETALEYQPQILPVALVHDLSTIGAEPSWSFGARVAGVALEFAKVGIWNAATLDTGALVVVTDVFIASAGGGANVSILHGIDRTGYAPTLAAVIGEDQDAPSTAQQRVPFVQSSAESSATDLVSTHAAQTIRVPNTDITRTLIRQVLGPQRGLVIQASTANEMQAWFRGYVIVP